MQKVIDADQLKMLLKASGLRLTRQRRAVFELLIESGKHLDANGLFERVRRRHPGISLATVYRTMSLFKRMGLVKALPLGESHQHFEAAGDVSHYHLVCNRCGQVTEVSMEEVSYAIGKLIGAGWEVESVEFYVVGVCPACRSKKG